MRSPALQVLNACPFRPCTAAILLSLAICHTSLSLARWEGWSKGWGGGRDKPDVIRRTGRQHCQAQEISIDARLPAQAYWPLSLRAELFCYPVHLECHRGRLSANTIGNGGRIGVGERDAVVLVFQFSAQVVYGGCRWGVLDP